MNKILEVKMDPQGIQTKEAPFAYEVKVSATLDEVEGIHLIAYQIEGAQVLNMGIYFSQNGLVFGTSVGLPIPEKAL
jgi:hypothetical protein